MIDKSVTIGSNVVIGKGCRIGKNVVIHNNITLYDGTVIGDGTEIFDNVVLGRPPKSTGNLVHKLKADYSNLLIGKNCSIGVGAVIYAGTKIGDHVLLGDYSCIREECHIDNHVTIGRHVAINHSVRIGQRTKIIDSACLGSYLTVEEDVFISAGVVFTNDNKMRLSGQALGESSGPYLKKGCKIGANAVFLPGIIVGEDAIIGAGSVVTKNILNGTVVMGVPARVVKKNNKDDEPTA